MPRRVLHKSGFVAESVIAVLPHAVEVRLVFSIVAAGKATVLVKPIFSRICLRSTPFLLNRKSLNQWSKLTVLESSLVFELNSKNWQKLARPFQTL